MTFVTGYISAAEEAAWTARKPFPVATNALRRRRRAPVWSSSGEWSDSGTGQASNLDDTAWPTSALYDDWTHRPTMPASGATALSTIYVLLDLDEGTDDDQQIDTLAACVDFTSLSAGQIAMTCEIANDEDFTTGAFLPGSPLEIASFDDWDANPTTKAIETNLYNYADDHRRYTTVRYARLKITTSAGSFGGLPHLYELVLGRRRALARQPRYPHDPAPYSSRTEVFEPDSGADATYVYHQGRTVLPLSFRPSADTSLGVDEAAAVNAWCVDSEYFTRPALWVDDPQAGPGGQGTGLWIRHPQNPTKSLPFLGPAARSFDITLFELPPFRSQEV